MRGSVASVAFVASGAKLVASMSYFQEFHFLDKFGTVVSTFEAHEPVVCPQPPKASV